jgi:hypothetical protein
VSRRAAKLKMLCIQAKNALHYGDDFQLTRTARLYNYELTPSGGGKVSFKVESFQPHYPGIPSKRSTIKDKSEAASGATLNGSFTVPVTRISDTNPTDSTLIRVTFSREVASSGVDYRLAFFPG